MSSWSDGLHPGPEAQQALDSARQAIADVRTGNPEAAVLKRQVKRLEAERDVLLEENGWLKETVTLLTEACASVGLLDGIAWIPKP